MAAAPLEVKTQRAAEGGWFFIIISFIYNLRCMDYMFWDRGTLSMDCRENCVRDLLVITENPQFLHLKLFAISKF